MNHSVFRSGRQKIPRKEGKRSCAKREKRTLALAKRDLQIINTFFNVKNMISPLSSSPNATQTLTPPSPPPTTTSGHHEPPFLAAKPPCQEECCNRSGILRILLKDSMEKIPSILHYIASDVPSFSSIF